MSLERGLPAAPSCFLVMHDLPPALRRMDSAGVLNYVQLERVMQFVAQDYKSAENG
jgi:hypothetical protein